MASVLKTTMQFFFPNGGTSVFKIKGKDLDTLNYFDIPKLTYLGNIFFFMAKISQSNTARQS